MPAHKQICFVFQWTDTGNFKEQPAGEPERNCMWTQGQGVLRELGLCTGEPKWTSQRGQNHGVMSKHCRDQGQNASWPKSSIYHLEKGGGTAPYQGPNDCVAKSKAPLGILICEISNLTIKQTSSQINIKKTAFLHTLKSCEGLGACSRINGLCDLEWGIALFMFSASCSVGQALVSVTACEEFQVVLGACQCYRPCHH